MRCRTQAHFKGREVDQSIVVIAGFVVDPKVWFMATGIYALFIAYFIFHSRHRLVQGTPEEEFESIRKAEQDL